ncbi:tetraspanin-33 isoform X1 [Pezoporus occidentalis]|uniref:tetraspanin-33 isoform X1 n=1 Tax=Pezoporus occidentalis TaxID=407982 RepID=UPI002F906EEA
MESPEAGATVSPEEDFSFVSPIVKFVLFFFNMLFWVISMVMVAVGVYAWLLKHAEATMACLVVDPAILLIVVGVLTFLIAFCGCIGSLRENIVLLQAFSICLAIIFFLQLVAGVLGFVFSDKARGKVSEIINGAIVHYRDDLDLQNLIDFGQKEFSCCGGISYKDWSQNMYFNCTTDNPSRERCSVPFSCCLPDDDEVRLVSSWEICSSSSILWMGAELPEEAGTPQSSRVRFLSPGCHQHHVWTWHTGHGLCGGQRCHLHPWLHRQLGQLDQQEPLPAGGHCAGAGSPTAGGHPAGSDPHQPDQRPDQTAALQPAAPGRPLVLIPVHCSVCPCQDIQTLDP